MASSSSSGSNMTYSNPPCKFLRRKCLSGCIFAPYFPTEEPTKFVNVHKIFGRQQAAKRDSTSSTRGRRQLARLKDPVYGCVGAISLLQRQVCSLQKELDATNAHIMRFARGNGTPFPDPDGGNESGNFVDPNTGTGFPLPYCRHGKGDNGGV